MWMMMEGVKGATLLAQLCSRLAAGIGLETALFSSQENRKDLCIQLLLKSLCACAIRIDFETWHELLVWNIISRQQDDYNDEKVITPIQELMIWAVLNNMSEMVECFWKFDTEKALENSFIIFRIFKSMSGNYILDELERAELSFLAKWVICKLYEISYLSYRTCLQEMVTDWVDVVLRPLGDIVQYFKAVFGFYSRFLRCIIHLPKDVSASCPPI